MTPARTLALPALSAVALTAGATGASASHYGDWGGDSYNCDQLRASRHGTVTPPQISSRSRVLRLSLDENC